MGVGSCALAVYRRRGAVGIDMNNVITGRARVPGGWQGARVGEGGSHCGGGTHTGWW